MSYYRDLREHISALEEKGKLVRVKREINKDTELHPLVRWQFRGLDAGQRKAFLFENAVDVRGRRYSIPVLVGGLAASEEIYAIGMMCRPDEIGKKWSDAISRPIEPVVVDDGPVKEVVHKGDSLLEHGGLDEFPIPISTPGFDNGPYTTASCWVTKDIETGVRNMGVYRGQIKAPLKMGVCLQYAGTHPNDCGIHWQKCNNQGVSLEAAVVLGGPPCVPYSAVQKLPYGTDELSIAGALAGRPLELVKCETVNIEVPAAAEIVLEGKIRTDILELEGAFGESHGYIDPRRLNPVFEVTGIMHRKNPIFVSFISQLPPSESAQIKQSSYPYFALKHLNEACGLKGVIKVVCQELFPDRQYMVIQMKKRDDYEPWNAMYGALGALRNLKVIVTVDEDIDPEDPMFVNWAIVSRSQPHKDVKIVGNRTGHGALNYVADGKKYDISDSAMLIDATKKVDFPPVALPAKQYMENAKKIWEELGLPELRPKSPWYGYSLGFWSKEAVEEAELALKGEHYKLGEKHYSQRIEIPRGANLAEYGNWLREKMLSGEIM